MSRSLSIIVRRKTPITGSFMRCQEAHRGPAIFQMGCARTEAIPRQTLRRISLIRRSRRLSAPASIRNPSFSWNCAEIALSCHRAWHRMFSLPIIIHRRFGTASTAFVCSPWYGEKPGSRIRFPVHAARLGSQDYRSRRDRLMRMHGCRLRPNHAPDSALCCPVTRGIRHRSGHIVAARVYASSTGPQEGRGWSNDYLSELQLRGQGARPALARSIGLACTIHIGPSARR